MTIRNIFSWHRGRDSGVSTVRAARAVALCTAVVLFLAPTALFGQSAGELVELRSSQSLANAVYLDTNASPEERAADLVRRMTLAEKLGQMTLVARDFLITPEHISGYHLGGLLSGGGSSPKPNIPERWAHMIGEYQEEAQSTLLGVPLLYGTDAVHGHGNLHNATIFPHHIGMGAANDPDLMRRAAAVTAREMAASGTNWNYSPAISVPQDIRWGRTYEGFSSDPGIVSELGAAEIRGLQESNLPIVATAKHYVADGGTRGGRDRGNAVINDEVLQNIHLYPYLDAIEADVGVIMASYSSVNSVKMHAHKTLINEHLKGELAFSGFIVSDWDALEELDGELIDQVAVSINAGVDMVMVPDEYVEFLDALSQAVAGDRISAERIDEAVYRILLVKFAYGIFDDPLGDVGLAGQVGSEEHRAVAREAVGKSLVLLKNQDSALPFDASVRRILVAGEWSDDIGAQSGGWTIEWQGKLGAITEGTTILEGIRQRAGGARVDYASNAAEIRALADNRYDRIVVVAGERPYAEGVGDNQFPTLSNVHANLVKAAAEIDAPVVTIIVSGRPLLIDNIMEASDAVVAAWLPGTEGAGVSDVLWNDRGFTGTLPFAWPSEIDPRSFVHGRGEPLFARGFGLQY